jgi:hypothetical protein
LRICPKCPDRVGHTNTFPIEALFLVLPLPHSQIASKIMRKIRLATPTRLLVRFDVM